MDVKKKALLIGDNSKAPYHPLKNIEQELCSIFNDELEICCTEEYDMLNYERISQFDLCISYADKWNEKLTKGQVAGVLAFVSSGKGLLVIHNGISIQGNFELAQLCGAKFLGHPPQKELEIKMSSPEHAIVQQSGEFEIDDEPYQFEFDTFIEKTILLHYESEGQTWPAAWAHEYGLGRVVYLMPGHSAGSFKNPVYRQILLRAGRWAGGLL